MNINEINKYKTALIKAAKKIKELDSELKKIKKNEEIAVIGYHCKFPGGANNSQLFWEKLQDGFNAVRKIKPDRFTTDSVYVEGERQKGKMYTQYASLLEDDIKLFDNVHFEVSSVEAVSIDPQQRLLLEVSWEALECSGLDIESLKGSKTGVFIGIDSVDYVNKELFSGNLNDIDTYTIFGVSSHAAAGRISYFYDFKGPAVCVNTGCSSSLSAISIAIDNLKNGQCDLALVGGVNIILNPQIFIGLSQFQAISPDGCCKTFDAAADGFGRGEGCGIVILKRVADAENEGNNIDAIIKGIAIGQDGKSNGFFAPNGLAEQNIMTEALDMTGLTPDDIDYLETHGTGTTLGDYIEAQAICEAYKNRKKPLLIGSVKSNIGHLEAAAGIAALIKVLLSLKNQQIPPSIHFNNANPNIDWSKLQVVDELLKWPSNGKKRRAAINAFGISGSLAHLILEEPEQPEEMIEKPALPGYILTLSTKTKNVLFSTIIQMRDYILTSGEELRDIAYSTNITKDKNEYRFAVTGDNKAQILEQMNSVLANKDLSKFYIARTDKKKQKIAFLFTGQGSIYKNAAREFYDYSIAYRKTFDLCDARFHDLLNISVKKALFELNENCLDQALYSQPIIFSLEYCLTKIWDLLNIRPDYVIGHSVGEYAALCYNQTLTFEDATKMIALRSTLMSKISPNGKMVGILADKETVQNVILESQCKNVSLAAVNAPKNVTISGLREEVDKIIDILHTRTRVFINDLKIKYPYHSVVMKIYKEMYGNSLDNIKCANGIAKVISCVSGIEESARTFENKEYWMNHLEQTVEFQAAVKEAERLGVTVFIEIGGNATLCGLAGQSVDNKNTVFVPTIRNGNSNFKQILESLKTLYLNGINLDWKSFHKEYKNRKVILPSYLFDKKVFWRDHGMIIERKEAIKLEKIKMSELNQLLKKQEDKLSNQIKILKNLSNQMQLVEEEEKAGVSRYE